MQRDADSFLDLEHAAEAAGVHYQTAYRWVRSGRLVADMVDGRYRVRREDLDALLEARSTPKRPTAPSAARLERAADKMHTALVEGDETTARQLARAIVTENTPMADLIQQVLVPPLRRIGRDWADGTLSIWVEHRASAIVERILGDVTPRRRGRRRGTAMVASVAGDRHALPTTMAAVTLRDNNWAVHHLGADTPTDDLVAFSLEHEVDVVVLTLSNPECREPAERASADIESSGTPVLIGGPGRTLDEMLDLVADAARAGVRTPASSRRSAR